MIEIIGTGWPIFVALILVVIDWATLRESHKNIKIRLTRVEIDMKEFEGCSEQAHKNLELMFRRALYDDANMPRFVPMPVFDGLIRDLKDSINGVKVDILEGFKEMKEDNKVAHQDIFDRLKKVEAIRGL